LKGKRRTHNWNYMGVSKGNERGEWKGELSYCTLCKKYAINSMSGFTYITKKQFEQIKVPNSDRW
jgi:hypothetical protein